MNLLQKKKRKEKYQILSYSKEGDGCCKAEGAALGMHEDALVGKQVGGRVGMG